MSQFGSGLSDTIGDDKDRGFFAINQRLQLNQLQEGEVRESLNGRMEGYWKPRKGVVEKSSGLTTGQTPLSLPFYLLDSPKTISAVTAAAGTITITITGHGLEAGSSGWATVTGLDPEISGSYLLTYVDADTLEYTVAGVESAIDQDGTLSQMPINDVANANVRASCIFSDPNSGNKEYIIVAMDTVAKKIDLDTLEVTDIPYPSGEGIGADGDMIQVFDKIMLFRNGQQALEWFPNGRPVLSASQLGTVVTMNVREHGLIVGTDITVVGLTEGDSPNGTFSVNTVVNNDTFTYIYTTSQTVPAFGIDAATATDGFTLSPGGTYTQPQTFNIFAKDVDIVNGLVTATVSGNTTIKAGDTIVVRQSETTDFGFMVGKQFQVVEATTTTVKWYAPIGDYDSNVTTEIFEFGGRFSVGGGFMHQPAAPWGVHFQRRLWVPYFYEQSGLFNAPTYTSRKITDEIAASDILDTTTFDQIENQFRISGGTADYVVGMHGFYDDALIILNRNSLHSIVNTQGSLGDTVVKELTSEIGCLARKSVVMRGNTMMFLSDDGVYSLEFQNDYNLRGADEPISKNIQPYIDRINKDYAAEAVGILFDNRYYLAIALDSEVGADDAQGNNSVLVYNFKNQGWESLDTYGDPQFLIKNFITGGAGVRNNLYAVTRNGGLHQIDATESSIDRLNVSNVGGSLVTPTINASLTTRGYDLKTMERKRFTDAQINMQNLAGDTGEYSISFAAEDPDNSIPIGTTTQFLGGNVLSPSNSNEAETASIRCRLAGIRGYTGTLILTRTIGSPKINSIKIAGSITNRQIISQQ
jgi:hypothetical protein